MRAHEKPTIQQTRQAPELAPWGGACPAGLPDCSEMVTGTITERLKTVGVPTQQPPRRAERVWAAKPLEWKMSEVDRKKRTLKTYFDFINPKMEVRNPFTFPSPIKLEFPFHFIKFRLF
jgi:hypothetical protein